MVMMALGHVTQSWVRLRLGICIQTWPYPSLAPQLNIFVIQHSFKYHVALFKLRFRGICSSRHNGIIFAHSSYCNVLLLGVILAIARDCVPLLFNIQLLCNSCIPKSSFRGFLSFFLVGLVFQAKCSKSSSQFSLVIQFNRV